MKLYFTTLLLIVSFLFSDPIVSSQTPNSILSSNVLDDPSPTDTLSIAKEVNAAIVLIGTDLEQAQVFLTNSLRQSLSINYANGIVAAYTNLAYVSRKRGDFAQTTAFLNSAVPYLKEGLHSRTSLAMFYSSYTSPYYFLGKFDSVYHYTVKALEIIDTISQFNKAEAIDVMQIYNNFGLFWKEIGDHKKAINFLQKAKSIGNKFESKKGLLQQTSDMVLGNLGQTYLAMNQVDSAMYFLRLSLQSPYYNPENSLNFAITMLSQRDTTSAISLLQEVIEHTKKTKERICYASATSTLGKVFFEQGNLKPAEQLLKASINTLETFNTDENTNEFEPYAILAKLLYAQKRTAEAYPLLQKSYHLLEAYKIKEQKQTIYALEFNRIENEQKLDIERVQANLKHADKIINNRNYLLFSVSALLVTLLILILYYIRQTRTERQLTILKTNQELDIAKLQAELRGEEQERTRLAQEIHDGILIKLANIKTGVKYTPRELSQLSREKYELTEHYQNLLELIDQTAKEIRSSAHNLMPDFLLKSGLDEAIYYFCKTTTANAKISLDFQWHGNSSNFPDDINLSIFRTIQELIHNVIKHASAKKILVQIVHLNPSHLSITIEDDGIGFDLLHQGKGIGLINVKNRLKIMNGTIDIQSEIQKGCSIFIELETLTSRQNER